MKNRAAALRDALRRPIVRDAGLAALLLAVTWWTVGIATSPIAVAVSVAAVAVRRRWPVAALAAASLAALAQMALAAAPLPANAAVPILLYTAATRLRRRDSLALLVAALAIVTAWSVFVGIDGKTDGWVYEGPFAEGGQTMPAEGSAPSGPTSWGGVLVLGPLLLGSWALGWGVRSRRAYLGEPAVRAREREDERDRQAALAVAAERARLTREVHDVVAHGLAVIVMQAQGGAAALDKRPEDTRGALDHIVATGRASLAEMRQVLSSSGDLDERPLTGLADLPRLIDRVRRAGTPVELKIEGPPHAVPPDADATSYRIVQEALTNTMKHAGPGARARVVVSYADDEVRVEARDDGNATGRVSAAGSGLRGMRERAALLGGEVTAGRGPNGGYLVRARIPLTGRASE
jgi:signal transduction histidine kinase